MTSQRDQGAHSPRLEAVIQVGNNSRCPLCITYILTEDTLTCHSKDVMKLKMSVFHVVASVLGSWSWSYHLDRCVDTVMAHWDT